MGIGYALAYRLGITPWEQAGDGGREQLEELFDREGEGAGARALDLGCGRGTHAIQLAERGWQVTGVDLVPQALTAARQRATDAGQAIDFIAADVTDLPAPVGTGYRFVLDIGCFHGLDDDQRRRFGVQLDRVTGLDATLLLLAFGPGGRGPMPRGAGVDDLARALPNWSIREQVPADTSGMPRPLRSRAPIFYRLGRT